MNTKLITVSGACCLSLLHVYACVSCFISILFVYMYVHMPSSPRFIAGVPSRRALPGYLITAPPPVCVPAVLGALAVWRPKKKVYYLLLRCSFCNWRASCEATNQKKNGGQVAA